MSCQDFFKHRDPYIHACDVSALFSLNPTLDPHGNRRSLPCLYIDVNASALVTEHADVCSEKAWEGCNNRGQSAVLAVVQ